MKSFNRTRLSWKGALVGLLLLSACGEVAPPGAGDSSGLFVQQGRGGTLIVQITGLPERSSASVAVAAPNHPYALSQSATLEDVRPGTYKVAAAEVYARDRVYAPTVTGSPVRVGLREAARVTVHYAPKHFEIRDGKIFDPEGKPFVIKGANVQGRNFGWEDRDPITYAQNITGTWKFNFLRVNEYVKGSPYCNGPSPAGWCKSYWGRGATPEEHDELVNAFTSKGVVVMFEAHDWSGSYPNDEDLQKLIAWHKGLAERYKDNPYVWFNVYNEPGYNCAPVSPRWLEVHRAVVRAIRDEVGAKNVIVADGSNFGIERDCGPDNTYKPTGPVPEAYSAVLSYGEQLLAFDGRSYPNIAFSFHPYCIWTPEPEYAADGEAAMNDYLDRVAAKGLAIFAGEFGSSGGGSCNSLPATETMYKVLRPRDIGRVVWHWWGGDSNKLVAGNGQGYRVNSATDPTNLTKLGKLVWDDTHDFDGTGSVYAPPPPPVGSLPRDGWAAKAFRADYVAALALDDDPTTRWQSDESQKPGQWFAVDMGAERTVSGLILDAKDSSGDYPRGYEVYVSNDGAAWANPAGSWGTPVASGSGQAVTSGGVTTLTFPAQSARYLKVVQTGSSGSWWSIHEFYATNP